MTRHCGGAWSAGGRRRRAIRIKGGVALLSRAGRRLQVRIFAERGENRYEPLAAGALERTDDVQAFGADVGLALAGTLGFKLRAVRSEIDSPLPGLSREVTSVSGGLSVTTDRLLWR
jgi:hypothetical protein